MDDKKKILLGEKDILAKENEDIFLNVSLHSTFSEIRNYKYDNVFDVAAQFKKERNESRDFRIYGIVDATVVDCDNLTISVFSQSGSTGLSGFVKNVQTSPMVYSSYNAFAKKRGKYLIELTGYTEDFVFLYIASNNLTYKNQIYSQQLIFKDGNGEFIDYGTQTIEINEDGTLMDINNDFYFLYDKHWIKKDLDIVEEKQAKVFFSGNTNIVVPESSVPNAKIFIALDKPSPFGLEKVTISKVSGTLTSGSEISITDTASTYNLPFQVTFAVGEQLKEFDFNSPIDTVQEFNEDVFMELTNFTFVESGKTLNLSITVSDATPKNAVRLNFQDIYQNRDYFSGIRIGTPNYSSSSYSYPMGAVLRNGLFYEGTPMEFYPVDNFSFKLTNLGATTILPVNPILGINTETLFTAGQTLPFVLNQPYSNTQLHSIQLEFEEYLYPTYTGSGPSPGGAFGDIYNPILDNFLLNGVPIVDYYKPSYKFDYVTIVAALKNQPINNISRSGWLRYNLDQPFTIKEDIANKKCTITAKSPGTRLDLKQIGLFPGDLFDSSSLLSLMLGITATTITPFTYSAQTPIQLDLRANFNNNSQAVYGFEFAKNGYDTLKFTSSTLNASVVPPTYYLVSGYRDILRNWDNATSKPVYQHRGVTSGWTFPSSIGYYNIGEAYINGLALLANLYFTTTYNTNSYAPGNNSLNKTHFGNYAGTYSADFIPAPITVIPETNNYYSVQTTAQEGYLGINNGVAPFPGSSAVTSIDDTRSFLFRTGNTPYQYYFFDTWNYNAYQVWQYNSISTIDSSLSPTAPRPLKEYMTFGNTTAGITAYGIQGTTPVSPTEITMAAQTAQVPFSTIYEAVFLSAMTAGQTFEFALLQSQLNGYGTGATPYPTIWYVNKVPGQTAGVTINEANNKMGGYSLIKP